MSAPVLKSPASGAARGRGSSSILIVTGLTAIVVVVELAILGAMGFSTAQHSEPVLRFFDPRRAPTMDEAWTGCVMDYALASHANNDVIFVGDSVCRHGIDPDQFQKATGLRAYNLGILFGGLGPDVAPTIAQAYLAKHPAPRLVVFCASPVTFETEVNAAYVQLHDRFVHCFAFEAPDLRSLEGIEGYAGSIRYLIQQGTVLGWYRPGDGRPRDLRDEFLDREKTQTYRSLESVTRSQLGFYPLIDKGNEASLDRRKRAVQIQSSWDREVRRLALICRETHVPLMIRLGPIEADASRDLDFGAIERWLRELKAANPELLIATEDRLPRYPAPLCYDSLHCNVAGAARFTKQLADEVVVFFKSTIGEARSSIARGRPLQKAM